MSVKNENVVLFCGHFLDRAVLRRLRKLQKAAAGSFDLVFVYDNTKKDFLAPKNIRCHLFDVDSIKSLGFEMVANRNPIWYHGDYPIIDFYRNNPGYRYYWRVEYDIGFFGAWRKFFKHFELAKADLLGTFLRPFSEDPGWLYWDTIVPKVDDSQKWAVFYPLLRFSNQALKVLDQRYSEGVNGHCEVSSATILSKQGLVMADIGHRWYTPKTFRFNDLPYPIPGKLLHPQRDLKWQTQRIKDFVRRRFAC